MARRTPAGIWLVGGCPPGSRAGHGVQTHRAGRAAQCAGHQLRGPLGSCWTESSRPKAGSSPGKQGREGLERPSMAVPRISKCPRLTDPLLFCSRHSPASDSNTQASDCLCCCILQRPQLSTVRAGGKQGGPGRTSLVSKADNFIPCHSSPYSCHPSSVS